jgi:hypothetical protein
MSSDVARGLMLVAVAIAAALVPLPPAIVERVYSTGIYPVLQNAVTRGSNVTSFALLDALLIAVGVAWIALISLDALRVRWLGWCRVAGRAALRTATIAAAAYLAFLGAWGLNYRRMPIVEKLPFEERAVTIDAARDLGRRSARELNSLYEPAAASRNRASGDADLAGAFSAALRAVGSAGLTRPARPKRTLLDPYFLSAGVDGMTDPFFLETLVASDLLPFERPFVVAHEWGHLAGFADEGEANFIGWLTCIRGSPEVRYSGWLFLYREVTSGLSERDRTGIVDALAAGPRADLHAIAERIRRHRRPKVAAAGWKAYDTYLKANRVEAGAGSYAEVVRLVLGIGALTN